MDEPETPDFVTDRLRAVVDRAVGSVPMSRRRGARIREELLAHLLDVFDEEFARTGDERDALARAERRFGEAGPLSDELHDAVPSVERYGTNLLFTLTREPAMRPLWIVLGLVVLLVGLGFVFPAVAQLRDHGLRQTPADAFQLSVLLPLGVLLSLGGIGAAGYGTLRRRAA